MEKERHSQEPHAPAPMPRRIGLADLYVRFAAIWANGIPIVNPHALGAAIDAMGVDPADVTDDWLRGLDDDWVHGRTGLPFDDDQLNMRYRLLLMR